MDLLSGPMHRMRVWSVFSGFAGFTAVAMGAAGAHALSDATQAALVEKAALYQLMHAVALLCVSSRKSRGWNLARCLWLGGIIFFCGSLYVKAFSGALHAPLAPAGGMLLMLGWLAAVWAGWRVPD